MADVVVRDEVVVDHLRVDRGGRTVLSDITTTIPAGQVVGLLGPSGSGKSTLIRAIVGVQVVASGTVTPDLGDARTRRWAAVGAAAWIGVWLVRFVRPPARPRR